MLQAVVIDAREPDWVREANWGVPVIVQEMETGDVVAYCEDGCQLVIERKTPDDFLHSLKDGRLFEQASRLAALRTDKVWPYILITGEMRCGPGFKVVVYRDKQMVTTGWHWWSAQGALLSLQEIGVPVVTAPTLSSFVEIVKLLARRDRNTHVVAPRKAREISAEAAFIASLPQIGPVTAEALLNGTHDVAGVLQAVCDPNTKLENIGPARKALVRKFLNLSDSETLRVVEMEATHDE